MRRQLEVKGKYIETLLADVVAAGRETDSARKELQVARDESRSSLAKAREDREAKETAEREKIAALAQLHTSEQLQKTNADAFNLAVQTLGGVVNQVTGVLVTPAQADYERERNAAQCQQAKGVRLQSQLEATETMLTDTRGKLFTAEHTIDSQRAEIATRDRELADARAHIQSDEATATERKKLELTVLGAGTLSASVMSRVVKKALAAVGFKRPRPTTRAPDATSRAGASADAEDEQDVYEDSRSVLDSPSARTPKHRTQLVGFFLVSFLRITLTSNSHSVPRLDQFLLHFWV